MAGVNHAKKIKASDTYYEYVPLIDGTPEEMVKQYIEITNSAYAERRSGLSEIYERMMDVRCFSDHKLEFKGTCFVMLEWCTCKVTSAEDFFPEEE